MPDALPTATATDAADLIAALGTAPRVATAPTTAPAAPAAPVTPAAAPAPAATGRDSIGREFDAVKFRPRKDKLGRWINKHAGRPPAAARATGPAAATPAPAGPSVLVFPGPAAAGEGTETPAPAAPDPHEVGAATLIAVFQSVLITLGEEEGKLSPAERDMLTPPLVETLRKHSVGDLPPEWALAFAAGSIVVSRLARPKTQTRVQWLRHKVADFFASMRGGQIARRVRAETADAAETTADPGRGTHHA